MFPTTYPYYLPNALSHSHSFSYPRPYHNIPHNSKLTLLEHKLNKLEHTLNHLPKLPKKYNQSKHRNNSCLHPNRANVSQRERKYYHINSLPESKRYKRVESAVNEVDRKYNERKLFYENLLLKQKLRKHGINNDVYGDTLSSFNDTSYRGVNGNRSGNDSNANEINKIIDNKLKPLEAKQNNFMQMMHNILHNNSNSSINGSVPPYYNYNYNDVVNNEMNANHQQQQQTPFVVQNACGNEIYGNKTVDVNSIVKEKVLETVLRERITKENAMRENELRKMLQREKQLREKEESIVKDKDKRILELENKEKLLEMQQNEMKKKLEGYEAATKNDVCRCAYSNMIVHPENENEKKNKIERTNSNNSTNNANNADINTPKKKPNTKRHNKSLIAHNPNIEYNENESDEWNNIDFSKYLNQKPKRNNTKKKRKKKNNSNNNMNNSVKKQIRLEKSDYPKMWLGRRVDSGVLDD
jgi:hypothetical protein